MQNIVKSNFRVIPSPVLVSYSSENSSKSDIISLKLKKGLSASYYNKETMQVILSIFQGLEKDSEGKVLVRLLASQLVKSNILAEKKSFFLSLSKFYKTQDLAELRFSPQDFYFLLFGDKKNEKILEGVRRHFSVKKRNFLPEIKSTGTSLSPLKIKSGKYHFSNIEENTSKDYFNLISMWWEEVSQGKRKATYLDVLNLFLSKEIANCLESCKDLIGPAFEFYRKSDFFALFILAIVKSQVVELSRKMGIKQLTKSFLPSYQKIRKSNKSLLNRFTPSNLQDKNMSPNLSRLKKFILNVALS